MQEEVDREIIRELTSAAEAIPIKAVQDAILATPAPQEIKAEFWRIWAELPGENPA